MKQKRRTSYEPDIAIAYSWGRVEKEIENLALALNVPKSQLTRGVGNHLCASQGWVLLGPEHHVPDVQRARAERSKAVEPVAVAERAHRPETRQRKVVSGGYWAKMSPKQRKAEMARRVAKRQKPPEKSKKPLGWWKKLSKAERAVVIAKRKGSFAATMGERRGIFNRIDKEEKVRA